MKRIILGYDASPAAERALEHVAELAPALTAQVVVASVAPVHEYAFRGAGTHFDAADPPHAHTGMAERAVAKLAALGVSATPITGLGETADTLVELAAAFDADLIVVGMSSRDLLTRLLGGTSDDVAHEAGCDVLLVH